VRQILATATIEKVTSKNGGPVGSSALRHSSNDTLAANPTAPVVEESGDEISKELLVLGITLALLHIAMCIMACGYWCLHVSRDMGRRQLPTYLSGRQDDGPIRNVVEDKKAD
ncbi:unnamed protein product, partial [Polarella glacialis]